MKRAVGAKRAQLIETARRSIGLTEGLPAPKIEIKTLLKQYEMFDRQLEDILTEVVRLLALIPGTKEMLTVPGVAVVTLAGSKRLCAWTDKGSTEQPQESNP
nr:hypothetical protein [Paenibacillus tritici]